MKRIWIICLLLLVCTAASAAGQNFSVGEIVTFGVYEQDGNPDNGKEPIEWRVLAVEDDQALLISEYGLDVRAFNDEDTDVTWEKSSLRAWLNKDFLRTAFTPAEQFRIKRRAISNEDNPTRGTEGGNQTNDRLFLLSIDEVNRYFSGDQARQLQMTEYAQGQSGNPWWWLRSPGYKGNYVSAVFSDGYVESDGIMGPDNKAVIRPAFWMDLVWLTPTPTLPPTPTPTNTPTPAPTRAPILDPRPLDSVSLDSIGVGDILTFGTYEQDNSSRDGKEYIQWQVLDVQGGHVMLISRYLLDWQYYHGYYDHVTWRTSRMRTWLNGTFYDEAFTEMEKYRILEVDLDNMSNPKYGTKGGDSTRDKVFLLSAQEAERFFPTDLSRISQTTAYAKSIALNNFAYPDSWWLRTPGQQVENRKRELTAYVGRQGAINLEGIGSAKTPLFVRPVIWVDMEGADAYKQDQSGRYISGCSMKSYLNVGDHAEVLIQVGLKIRKEPAGAETGYQAFGGKDLTIIGGPVCVNDIVWWQINFMGHYGWSMEGQDGTYYLGKTGR